MYHKMLTNRKLIIWSSILVLFSFLYGMNYCSRNMTNVNHQNTKSDVMCVKPSFNDRTYQPTGKYSTENLIYYGTNKAIALKYNNPKMIRYFTRNGKSDEVRRFPRCIGIGVAKSGTSAIKIFLGEHPYMVLTKTYEAHFFDDHSEPGYSTYLKMMAHSKPWQIGLEKTPHYFSAPNVPAQIHKFDPSIKLLLIVKNPVDRTVSDYLHFSSPKALSFEEVVFKPNGSVSTENRAVYMSLYDVHFSRWLSVFNRNQIHIVDGDQMMKDPASELKKVEAFLEIPHFLTADKFYYNSTKGFHCFKTKSMPDGYCLSSNKGHVRPKVGAENILYKVDGVKRPQNMTENLYKLKQFYKPHNVEFYKLAGQTFKWD